MSKQTVREEPVITNEQKIINGLIGNEKVAMKIATLLKEELDLEEKQKKYKEKKEKEQKDERDKLTVQTQKFIDNEVAKQAKIDDYSCERAVEKLKYFLENPQTGTMKIKSMSPTNWIGSDPDTYSLNCEKFRNLRSKLNGMQNVYVSGNQTADTLTVTTQRASYNNNIGVMRLEFSMSAKN
jgi:hypothetical protein